MDLSTLNQNQEQGVLSTSQYIRVVAGAGSGKTRVLTYRIAHLIQDLNVPPYGIMAVTFTNKAAKEIKNRVIDLVGDCGNLFLGTIHSWCARFLRYEAEHINYPKNFTILDDEDQLNIMKEIFVRHNLPKTDPNIKGCLDWIGKKKTEGIEYDDIKDQEFPNQLMKDYLKYFKEYTDILSQRHSLDFDDLLLKSIDILLDEKNGVRSRYTRYSYHILVDEFQDINDVQFKLITLLMSDKTNLYVVGDPDQTIYTWRGANHRLIMDFEENINHLFKNVSVETIILNQNYRSSKNILEASNALINFNKERVKKNLISNSVDGEKVTFFNARTAKEESINVVENILSLHKKGVEYKNIAVLYRANYLSREIESTLVMKKIPYKVFGGMKFFQRKEIKDVVAYFKLIVNEFDDTSFNRIINVPKRSIGPGTLDKLRHEADHLGQPLFIYVKENINSSCLSPKQKASWINVLKAMEVVQDETLKNNRHLSGVLEQFVDSIGYYNYLKEEEDNPEDRIENIKELIISVDNFLDEDKEATFEDFVNNAMLQSSQDDVNNGDYVSLMTVHTAKGLEYDYVFVYGMGEGVFPSQKSVLESKRGIEEERRLAYVAFTRARKRLFVSSNQDYSFVLQSPLRPSRFIKEAGILEERKETGYIHQSEYHSLQKNFYKQNVQTATPTLTQTNGVTSWNVGDRVSHITYGEGTVVEIINKLIIIKFDDASLSKKTFLGSHIALKKL